MELIAAILLAGPLGFFARTPAAGRRLYLLVWAAIFPVQTFVVVRPGDDWWQYALVNAAILGLGLGLNHAGSKLRRRRQAHLALMAVGVAAGLCAATLSPSPGQAAPGKTKTLRIFQKARSIQLTKADGTVRKKLPIAEPQAGDVLDMVFDMFAGNHARHARKRSGTNHLRCTFVATGPPDCVSHAAFGSSMLVVEGNPGKVVLGTGKYFGATGRVLSNKEVKGAPPSSLAHNDIDIVARIDLR